VEVNETAKFSASGGTGSYSWEASGGSPGSGSGSSFSTRYSREGSYGVDVRSGDQRASCEVRVNPPPCKCQNPSLAASEVERTEKWIKFRFVLQNCEGGRILAFDPGDSNAEVKKVNDSTYEVKYERLKEPRTVTVTAEAATTTACQSRKVSVKVTIPKC
jgi:hypothetical protein